MLRYACFLKDIVQYNMREETVSKTIKFSIIRVFIRNNVIKCRPTTILKNEA